MNKVDPIQFKHKFSIEFLPNETLLGIKSVNCEILCTDDQYRPVAGVELGFIFFTITYVNISL
jgi:hypothetical protein